MNAVDVVYEGHDGPWTVARVAQKGAETLVAYTDEHLARQADLCPIRHGLQERSRTFAGMAGDHLPGLLADSLPDAWGKLVLRRDMRAHGVEQPTPLQMLSWLGRRTMGALTFRPTTDPGSQEVRLVDLDRVQAEMLRQLGGTEAAVDVEAHLALVGGTGAGGARPKIAAAWTETGQLVVDHGEVPDGATPWLVKFHADTDPTDLSAIEASYLQMAAAAGITVCEHRLLPGASGTQYLAVRRFDREQAPGQPRRLHMASAAGLLEAYPERGQFVGYTDVIRAVRLATGRTADVHELARRAIFNVVAHNRDDHARNVACLWTAEAGWHLAPAYDLTHSMGPRPTHAPDGPGEHYMDVAGKGAHITRGDLHSLAGPADLTTDAIDEMIDKAVAAVAAWPQYAADNGVSAKHAQEIARRIPALHVE